MVRRHEISKAQYESIRHLLPGEKGKAGPTMDNHKFLNGIFYYLKTGTPWRDLPPRYGHWKSVHRRFSRWCKKGIFEAFFNELVQSYGDFFEDVQLDSSMIKAHQHSAGGGKKKANL